MLVHLSGVNIYVSQAPYQPLHFYLQRYIRTYIHVLTTSLYMFIYCVVFYLFQGQRSIPSASSPQNQTSTSQQLQGFKVGMRLEAKDRKYPTLTCVATITSVKNKKLLIHFDGWGNEYDYLCEVDSTDIHPMGWAARNGHQLQKPKGTYILLYYTPNCEWSEPT